MSKNIIQIVGSASHELRKIIKETNDWLRNIGYKPSKKLSIFVVDEQNAEAYYNKYSNGFNNNMPFPGITKHRGFCAQKISSNPRYNGTFIVVYATRYETPESVRWLLVHELTHYAINSSPLLKLFFEFKLNDLSEELHGDKDYLYNHPEECIKDDLHEKIPEEGFANAIASLFESREYTREWWCGNIEKIDRR